MPIAKLAASTAQLIGSSVSITSPLAVIKELLDNAIDAGADSVEITISPNTLDSIRIRDNGHGISVEDLDSIGRAAHTSKLRTFDELNTGRVQTLGFRGQAMASINNITTVHITTKTADEPVATKIQLAANIGGVGKKYSPVSCPTGSTVQVTGLFYNMPPRRQLLLKENKKTMAMVKELLMAYVLANADLRITFKIAGDDKQPDKFGQTKERDMKKTILEVFGPTVSANGETHRFAKSTSKTNTFTLLAFLPSPSCDRRIIQGKRSYISVNGRPMSPMVGIGKALTGLFRAKVQQSLQRRGLEPIAQPLLVLAISCPFESYDANVATMKDDVLFADKGLLFQAFEELCSATYDNPPGNKVTDSSMRDGREKLRTHTRENIYSAPPPEKLVSVQMRTTTKVNMLRTNSDATDEETNSEFIEVMIPEINTRDVKEDMADSSMALKERATKVIRGIERYFQPAGADFEIATDDTATQEIPAGVNDKSHTSSKDDVVFRRLPLNTVTDSTLNILANTQDSASDDSGQGDASRLSDLNNSSWSIQSLMNHSLRETFTRGVPIASAASPRPSSPLIRGQQSGPRQGANPPWLPIVGTPPPSDPTREEQSFLPASHLLRPRAGRELSPAHSSSSSDGTSLIDEPPRVQPPPISQNRIRNNSRRVTIEPRIMQSRMLGLNGPMGPRPMLRGGDERLVTRSQAEHEDNYREADTPRGELRSPIQFRRTERRRGGHQFQMAESAHSNNSLDVGAPGTQPPSKRLRTEEGGDGQNYTPVVASRLPADAGNWDRLPLEHTPASMATLCTILSTDVGFSDVRICMNLYKHLDAYIRSGELEYGLSNLTR